jgi:hypothetical protein
LDVQSKQRQLEKGFAPYIINILNNLFMKKKVITLSCIAAVAIATFVGTKAFQSNAYGANGLFVQNVEALSQGDGDGGGGALNTGPGKTYDCPGLGTGDGKMCMCENPYSCTQIPC